jgi:hypothetical protein
MFLAVAAAMMLAISAGAADVKFKKHVLDRGTAESCAVADLNGDGLLDIVSGDNWYMAPEYRRRPLRDLEWSGEYLNSCADGILDVNGDGAPDVITAGFFNVGFAWVENPKNWDKLPTQYTKWKVHPFTKGYFVETFEMVDIDGDGRDDILSDDNEPIRWMEAPGNGQIVEHLVGKNGTGHGIGYGDVNGDKKIDILTPDGWYEQPADPRKGEWAWHGEWKLESPNDPMLVLDVNGDGLNDVIYGAGHNYGLFWMEQAKGGDGARQWKQHEIDKSYSQVHPLTIVDLNGDKLPDLVTGKRYRAHNDGDPGGGDYPKGGPRVVCWYELDRSNPKMFVRHDLEGNEAEMKEWPFDGIAGGGLQIPVVDIDKDGDLDILTPGKSGLFLWENLTVVKPKPAK